VVDQNFIHHLIPELAQKKTEKELNKLLVEKRDGTLKMQIIKANGVQPITQWNVNLLHNNMNLPSGIILTTKI